MTSKTVSHAPGALNQFASLYLRARWFVGAGLLMISGIYAAFELGSQTTWVLGAAGLVIIVHAGAMALMSLRSVLEALVVDIPATPHWHLLHNDLGKRRDCAGLDAGFGGCSGGALQRLWIGRDLARKMSGDLEYSRRDGLTIFELKLPAAPSEPSRPELVGSVAS